MGGRDGRIDIDYEISAEVGYAENYAMKPSNATTGVQNKGCTNTGRAYVSIIINVLPLWIVLTALIVFVLITIHRNLRATKVYDNCTKETSHYVYFVELRTGDTSSTYNRRRTTITIDMFDDNQTTLARIAVPGHIIFGKKDSPIPTIDDEKYFELRVTRFWLYRSSRLRKVATIRLTHTCSEPEARIMIYGLEIRSNERQRSRSFFPIMSYISTYGPVNKPNACFDQEPLGTISNIGGSQPDTSSISEQLNFIDYTTLLFFMAAIIFFATSQEVLPDSFTEFAQSSYKGIIVGASSYALVLVLGLTLRFVIKSYYSLRLGTGPWAWTYYVTLGTILIVSIILWIYSTVATYKQLCPDYYPRWILSIVLASVIVIVLFIITWVISVLIQLFNPKYNEHYVLPEDVVGYGPTSTPEPPSKRQIYRYPQDGVNKSVQPTMLQQQSWNSPMVSPYGAGPQQQQSAPPSGTYTPQPTYPHPQMLNPVLNPPASYKTLQTAYMGTGYDTPPAHAPPLNQSRQTPSGPSASPSQPNYHQQTTGQVNLQGIKATKKIGSSESTGSTYYQQLMKNKGGVKSISQYGELLKHKKVPSNKNKNDK